MNPVSKLTMRELDDKTIKKRQYLEKHFGSRTEACISKPFKAKTLIIIMSRHYIIISVGKQTEKIP